MEAMDNVGLCNLQIGLSFFVQDIERTRKVSLTRDAREDKVGWIPLYILSSFYPTYTTSYLKAIREPRGPDPHFLTKFSFFSFKT